MTVGATYIIEVVFNGGGNGGANLTISASDGTVLAHLASNKGAAANVSVLTVAPKSWLCSALSWILGTFSGTRFAPKSSSLLCGRCLRQLR